MGDLFFVAILDMNVAGAALATVLAQAVSVVLSLAIIRRQKLPFTMTLKDIGINPEIWKFVKVGGSHCFSGDPDTAFFPGPLRIYQPSWTGSIFRIWSG